MYVEHAASVWCKSVIVLTAGFSIDILIGDFSALILHQKYTDGRSSF